MFPTKTLAVKFLNSNHLFQMGGRMYKVDDVHPNLENLRVVHASDICDSNDRITLIVGKKTQFKVYTLAQ